MNTLTLTIVCVVLGLCQAATTTTTHRPHHSHHTRDPSVTHATKEPVEKENFFFYYVPSTHHLILISSHKCYVDTTLTAAQLTDVHTDAGLRALEFKILQQLASFASTTKDMLNTMDSKHCGQHATEFYILQ